MEDNTKKEPVEPEKEGLFDKARKLADKADDFIDENVEKVKKSKAFESVAGAFDKAGDYIEDKVDDIKNTNFKEKLESFSDKAEEEAKEKLARAKEKGKNIAGKAADKLEDLAEGIRKKAGQDKKPENS